MLPGRSASRPGRGEQGQFPGPQVAHQRRERAAGVPAGVSCLLQRLALVQVGAQRFIPPLVHLPGQQFPPRTRGDQRTPLHEAGVRLIAGTDAGIDNLPHHQCLGGLQHLAALGLSTAQVLAMATTEAAAALGVGQVTGRLAAGHEADLLVAAGDPLADLAALSRIRRVVARGQDYVPDGGRFDVSAPGTPFADPDRAVNLRLLTEATRRREAKPLSIKN
jgi:hypothetical protein